MHRPQTLETFAANKFKTTKRFGLEGCEALVAGTKTLLDTVSSLGVSNVVFGMPHRGRLNILANVVRKPLVRGVCWLLAMRRPRPSNLAFRCALRCVLL